ncbi:MAG: spore coat protein CotJB [Blautia sp.]|nr:spore coat protein CotJB [Lachnoclostridium sp.]MCM1212472.1 spore coat protein CotJB [Blautia sp.]
MSKGEHLAIASVPMQDWGELYDEKEALFYGTIFAQLNKPFFITEQDGHAAKKEEDCTKVQQQREDLLLQIQKVSFVVDDVRLYMDTHPKDMQGLALLKTMLKRRKELLKEYATEFYPLTMDCMADIYGSDPDLECYCWQNGSAPWEGACV